LSILRLDRGISNSKTNRKGFVKIEAL